MADGTPPLRALDRLLAGEAGPWRGVFETSPWGAALLDPGGAILLANAALARLCGAPHPGPLAGLDFAVLFAPARRAELAAALRRALTADEGGAGPPSVIADLPPTPATEDAAALISFTPVTEADGTASGAIARVVDVSAQKRLEQQLAQAQKMQAIGQLAGGIAHDFNNLLAAILLTADEALTRPGLPAETMTELGQIRRSAERGAALVAKLLAFGRKQTMQPRVLMLNDAIQDVSTLLRRLLGARVSLVVDLDPVERRVRIDATQFDQVIVNLAVNARDAMPQGGRLTLRTGQVNLFRPLVRGRETIPPGRYAMVEVEDSGTGIPPDYLDRIFEPFFSTKKESGGTGLGLATVWGIVRQMDGFVTVDSMPGEGTTFRVFLPRYEGEEMPDRPAASPRGAPIAVAMPMPMPAPPSGAGSSGIVLLAEDEEPIRRLAAIALGRAGWRVVEAAGGDEALALIAAQAERPAALVTDIVMPGADGQALVQAARARWPDLPVLVVSGYAESLGGEGLSAMGVAWLAKPYAMKDLVARLRAACAERPARPASLPRPTTG